MIHGYSWCFPVLLPFHLSALLCPKCHTPGCPFLRHFHFCLPAYQRVPQDGQWQFQPLRYVFIGNQKKRPLSGGDFIINRSEAHIFVLHPELRVIFMGKSREMHNVPCIVHKHHQLRSTSVENPMLGRN